MDSVQQPRLPDEGQNAVVSGNDQTPPQGFIEKKDYGHALELQRAFDGQFRWIPERNAWTRWNGHQWKLIPDERMFVLASKRLQRVYEGRMAAAVDLEMRKLFDKKRREACTASHISGTLKFLAGRRDVLTRMDRFDRDPWLFNVNNGSFDLRSLTLQSPDPAHLMTKRAHTPFKTTAQSEAWDRFIERILPNLNVRRYVQRQLGKAMVGAVLEERLDIWWGTGANGKTTLARVMLNIFGDYAQRAAPNLLIASRYERHPTEVADLMGSRLVFSVEADQGKRLAEALVKDLTGGDRKKARFMHQDFFQFEQTFDIVLIVNHKPVVIGTDPGIWRRIRLIPFEVQIPPGEQRPQDELVATLLRDSAAILNWLIEGLQDYRRNRDWIAEEVRAATDTYRDEMDHVGKFVKETCEVKPRANIEVSTLYMIYQAWCTKQGEDPLRKNVFGTTMRERGFVQTQVGQNRTRSWVGLRVHAGYQIAEEQ